MLKTKVRIFVRTLIWPSKWTNENSAELGLAFAAIRIIFVGWDFESQNWFERDMKYFTFLMK